MDIAAIIAFVGKISSFVHKNSNVVIGSYCCYGMGCLMNALIF